MNKSRSGFTIVELLIVIVVIAILAAISIVAYNGIQTRAENSKTIQAVSQYAKVITLYAVDKGSFPITSYSCLGSPARCGNMTDGTDPGSCGGGQTTPKSDFSVALSGYASNLPNPSEQQINCGGKQYSGAWFHSADGINASMRFYLKGSASCTDAGVKIDSAAKINDTTVCRATLTSIL